MRASRVEDEGVNEPPCRLPGGLAMGVNGGVGVTVVAMTGGVSLLFVVVSVVGVGVVGVLPLMTREERTLPLLPPSGLPVLVGRRSMVGVDGDSKTCVGRGGTDGDTVDLVDEDVKAEWLGAEGRGGTRHTHADVVMAVVECPPAGVGEVTPWRWVGLGMLGKGNGELERAPTAAGEVGTVCTDVGRGGGGLLLPCDVNAPLRGNMRVVEVLSGACWAATVAREGVDRVAVEGERDGLTAVGVAGGKVNAGMGSGRRV
jgi:hypothetical protein